ncbi:uncharacterized protein TNCV_4885061 [Trichonephila clavipes]|nr:uncharacterized protein TNCV_4885061 [Trichonephila clavipes]
MTAQLSQTKVIRAKVGALLGVNPALFHCSSSVEKPMHGQCPIGKDSWCYYQRALSCGKKPNEKYKGLSNEVLNTIKPTYLELCTKELLTKCLHGKTQSSNECLNGVIWQRVPKEVFVCLKILKSGALDAVIQFNDGYKGCVEIFKKLNITPRYFTLKAYKHLDINRINDAERHSTPNVKQRRKILRATREKYQCFREIESISEIDYDKIADTQVDNEELNKLRLKPSLNFKQYPLECVKLLWCDISTAIIRPFIPQPLRIHMFQKIHNLAYPV